MASTCLGLVLLPPPSREPAIVAGEVAGLRMTAKPRTSVPAPMAARLKPRPPAVVVPRAEIALTAYELGLSSALGPPVPSDQVGGVGRPKAVQPQVLSLQALAVIPLAGRLGYARPTVLTRQATATAPVLAQLSSLLSRTPSPSAATQAQAAAPARMSTPIAELSALPSAPAEPVLALPQASLPARRPLRRRAP